MVYVCSFSRDVCNGFIMDRFCEKIGYRIKDALRECIRFFAKEISTNISIILDRRFYNINDIGLDFCSSSVLHPNFYYVNYGFDYRISRKKTSESFWKKELKNYDESKTVYENIRDNKYAKIFNCGYVKVKIKTPC